MKQAFHQFKRKNSTHDTVQLFSFLHSPFLLLISEVARIDRDSMVLVRNDLLVSVQEKLPTQKKRQVKKKNPFCSLKRFSFLSLSKKIICQDM